eukprot:CAMPEP_0119527770 /NCGR_PEP_ID=MMETSP1344-20130328/42111_1 /TAXON_ID=236787 /ORGANISM="Florenciella parvula, Strain CCMP2471" /LENGTH=41 /DNA_ID= /DNA_START= /DNA_END= /DNA_ORIENTATION=
MAAWRRGGGAAVCVGGDACMATHLLDRLAKATVGEGREGLD